MLELLDPLVFHGGSTASGSSHATPTACVGILFAPLLHGGFGHLLANTVPLVMLGWLVMVRRLSDFFAVTAIVWLLGGLGVWLFAPPHTVHIGASGLIFGYLGFLLLRGYFERSFGSIFLSIVVGLLYGSAIWGVLLPPGRLLARPPLRLPGRHPDRPAAGGAPLAKSRSEQSSPLSRAQFANDIARCESGPNRDAPRCRQYTQSTGPIAAARRVPVTCQLHCPHKEMPW